MKLSGLTLFIGLYIIISASFAQQLWRIGQKILMRPTILILLALVFLEITLALLHKCIQARLSLFRIILVAIVCALAYAFSWSQPYMTEKAHVLEYGLLAWLALRDFCKGKQNVAICVLYAAIFVLIVGSLDEGFQKLLPYRVGEIRDVLTNLLSGSLGISLFLACRKKLELS
jgi:hypothetical protein